MSDLLLDLEAIETRAKRAHSEIVRLCKPGEHWRMSIPAQVDRDSDLVLSATANDAERLLEAVTQLQARVDVLTDQVAGRDATIQRVRDRHSQLKIYTECGHDEGGDCTGEIVEIESDVGWTCQDGYLYSICHECCARNRDQTEECAASHDHGTNDPLCPTRKDLDGDPADDGSQK